MIDDLPIEYGWIFHFANWIPNSLEVTQQKFQKDGAPQV